MHDAELSDELLDHLAVEFGDHGRRAGEFLRTAADLVHSPTISASPRLAECVAYCLREALKTIPQSQAVGGGGEWRSRSRAVTEAKQRYEQIRGLPGTDADAALEDLLRRIDALGQTHVEETIHQKRLIAVMVARTGAEPLASGINPVDDYQDLLSRLDGALHGAVAPKVIAEFWAKALAILRQLFLPPDERHRQLSDLAGRVEPSQADVATLKSLLAAPSHLEYFLARISYPGWLSLLDAEKLLGPPRLGVWPVLAAVQHLRKEHSGELAALLTGMFDRWGADSERVLAIGRAALELGSAGQDLVLASAQRHPGHSGLGWLAVQAAREADPADEYVQQVADIVLSSVLQSGADVPLKPLLEMYVGGIVASNYGDRIKVLCYKLVKVPENDHYLHDLRVLRGGSVAGPLGPGEEEQAVPLLVRALVQAVSRAAEWAPAAELLGLVSKLRSDLRDRFRALTLANWAEQSPRLLVDEVTSAISSRNPTGDDIGLVDTAVRAGGQGDYTKEWAEALGNPPTITDTATAIATGTVPPQWLRVLQWAALLPATVTESWTGVMAVLSGRYGEPTRSALERRPTAFAEWGRTPITESELRDMTPDNAASLIAAWRPDPRRLQIGTRELARTLQAAVKSEPARWAATPLRTAIPLHEPMYIGHYLRGLAEADSLEGVPVSELVDLINVTFAHPWEPTALGDPSYDYDPDWSGAEAAAIDLIKALAIKNQGFADRDDEVWELLERQARDRMAPTQSRDDEPLTQALSRPCTCALDAVFDVAGYEHRRRQYVRPEALALLADALALTGQDGAQHRALIAPRLAFLRHVAPQWVADHLDELFGSDAHGLGQTTIDLALRWGMPDSWLLENLANQVRDAVKRKVPETLAQYLVGMLRNLPGYTPQAVVAFLRSQNMLPDACCTLADLFRAPGITAQHIANATSIWEEALVGSSPDELTGFGWYAEMEGIDDTDWNRLTRETLDITRGHIDSARRVSDRASRQEPTADTLEILNLLLRGIQDGWDHWNVLNAATLTIKKAGLLSNTHEYQRLRTSLLERGVDLG